MLVTKTIKIKINNSKLSYYRSLGYQLNEDKTCEVSTEHLTPGSNVEVEAICDICGLKKIVTYKYYNTITSVGGIFVCSNRCGMKKQNILQTEKTGYGHPLQNPIVMESVKKKMLQRYGYENSFERETTKKKIRETTKRKWLESFKNKHPESEIVEYDGVNLTVICKDCKKRYIINRRFYVQRLEINHMNPCTYCNPVNSPSSSSEKELFKFVEEEFSNLSIEKNTKKVLANRKELDIYIPEKKIAIEFNGVFWHSELCVGRDYHLEKTKRCEELGISLVHVWEDDWKYKRDIVKSRIRNLLGISRVLYARKCVIKTIDRKTERRFLEENHIQGYAVSMLCYGLYHENELVSVMSFSRGRFKTESIELLRYCSKLGVRVTGGANKLFKHYIIQNPNTVSIVTYASRDWSAISGNTVYDKMGFKMVSETGSNYFWVVDGKRFNRFRFRKEVLVRMGYNVLTVDDTMRKLGYWKAFDSGSFKYEWKR